MFAGKGQGYLSQKLLGLTALTANITRLENVSAEGDFVVADAGFVFLVAAL